MDDIVILGKLISGEVPTSPQEANPDVADAEVDALVARGVLIDRPPE